MAHKPLEEYESELAAVLREFNPGKVALAGFRERHTIDRQVIVLRLARDFQLSILTKKFQEEDPPCVN